MAVPPPNKRIRLETSISVARSHSSDTVSSSSTLLGHDRARDNSDGDSLADEFETQGFAIITRDPVQSPAHPSLLLYYDNITNANQYGPRRAVRILPLELTTGAGKGREITSKLMPGWSHAQNCVNLFIERGFQSSVQRRCNLHFQGNPENITASDVRRQIAKHLGIDDIFSIQLEHQTLMSTSDSTMLNDFTGVCRRPVAPWNHTNHNDKTVICKLVASAGPYERNTNERNVNTPYKWIRVSNVEYIKLVTDSDITTAITPAANATVGDIRSLIAELKEVPPEAVHLQLATRELRSDDIPLVAEDITPSTTIIAWHEWMECTICGDDEIPFSEFTLPITETCCHERKTCSACIQRWIVAKLDEGVWEKIACPGEECEEILQHDSMRRFLTPDEFDRYDQQAFRAATGAMEDFHWCLAPGCGSGQVHEEGNIFHCHACKYDSCLQCNRLYHKGETCEQYKARTGTTADQERASEAEVEKISKECPGCKMRIQKVDGCDHITCRKCTHQFCWLCLANYTEIHRIGVNAHKQDCMYHGGRRADPHGIPLGGMLHRGMAPGMLHPLLHRIPVGAGNQPEANGGILVREIAGPAAVPPPPPPPPYPHFPAAPNFFRHGPALEFANPEPRPRIPFGGVNQGAFGPRGMPFVPPVGINHGDMNLDRFPNLPATGNGAGHMNKQGTVRGVPMPDRRVFGHSNMQQLQQNAASHFQAQGFLPPNGRQHPEVFDLMAADQQSSQIPPRRAIDIPTQLQAPSMTGQTQPAPPAVIPPPFQPIQNHQINAEMKSRATIQQRQQQQLIAQQQRIQQAYVQARLPQAAPARVLIAAEDPNGYVAYGVNQQTGQAGATEVNEIQGHQWGQTREERDAASRQAEGRSARARRRAQPSPSGLQNVNQVAGHRREFISLISDTDDDKEDDEW